MAAINTHNEASKSKHLYPLGRFLNWTHSSTSRGNDVENQVQSTQPLQPNIRPGYPTYSSLLGTHSEFQTFRRFRTTRMRMLLLKQDIISKLEQELNEIDERESAELFLGSCRRDKNTERETKIAKLDEAFKNYDDFLQRTHWTLNIPSPNSRDLLFQQYWLETRKCIPESERAYIHTGDRKLLHIGLMRDRGMAKVANVVEICLEKMHILLQMLRKLFCRRSNRGSTLTVSNSLIRRIARSLAASIAIILLLVPVIILNAISRALIRLAAVFLSATLFVSIVTVTSQASLGEIFVGGVTYTAVLVVFVSGNGVWENHKASKVARAGMQQL